MLDQPSNIRRRPVDALFGDSVTPGYTVEPPQPVTTVAPPPPEPVVAPTGAQPLSQPSAPPPPILEERILPRVPPPAEVPATVAPAPTPAPPSGKAEAYFAFLPDTIRQLYDEVDTQLSNSPTVANYCMGLLKQAREAYNKQDVATAEYYAEMVDAKLRRSAQSMQASRSPAVWLLWLWELAMLTLSGALIAITYVPNLTLFGLPVAADFIILMRAIGWGGIGGVIGALYNLPWFIQFREYDPAYNMNYFARPLQGLLIGAILFLISQAGILAGGSSAPVAPGEVPVGPVFLYVIAALAGFKQEYVYEFFDNILKTIFRIPQLPSELQTPTPPK